MVVGLGAAVYTGFQGYQATSESGKYSSLNGSSDDSPESRAVRNLLQALRDERRLTGEVMADPRASTTALEAQWATSDRAIAAARSAKEPVLSATDLNALVALRPQIVARTVSLVDAVAGYSTVIVAVEGRRSTALSEAVPDPRVVRQDEIDKQLTNLTEALDVSDALVFSAFSDQGMPSDAFDAYARVTGDFKASMRALQQSLPADEAGALNQLTLGPDGEVVAVVQRSVLHGGVVLSGPAVGSAPAAGEGVARMDDARVRVPLPVPRPEWRQSTAKMSSGLVALQAQHLNYAARIARDVGTSQLTQALLGSVGLLVFAVVVLLVSLAVSRALIGRLRRLQRDTIELSRVRLPAMVNRLRDGDQVDVERELPPLDYGTDEIGQVADAFGEAQRTAVIAAAREAETRAGLRKVFLSIAHRSQTIIYRQLKVLDEAERTQEDPEQLQLLFELDHLATRARRHAENLIILAGGRAGRQWRDPVNLLQLVRSAISETKDYARVTVIAVPDVTVQGGAAADLIHLLAELVDNAAAFTPPSAGVDVSGHMVGRGLAIEIEDRGLGLEPDQLTHFNDMLLNPPDFQRMALADEPRLGLFVVARLAERHGIRVTLMESVAYGGAKVVVVIPHDLLVRESRGGDLLELAGPNPLQEVRSRDADSWTPQILSQDRMSQDSVYQNAEYQDTTYRHQQPMYSDPAYQEMAPQDLAYPDPAYPGQPYQSQPYPGQAHPGPAYPAPVHQAPTPRRPRRERSVSPQFTRSLQPLRPVNHTSPNPSPAEPMEQQTPLFDAVTDERGQRSDEPSLFYSPPPAARPEPPSRTTDGRPALPRRVRQTHLSLKLIDAQTPAPEPQSSGPGDAETARLRMSALQRGTLRGRNAEPKESN